MPDPSQLAGRRTWLEPDQVSHSFAHVEALFGTARVTRSATPRPLQPGQELDLAQVEVTPASGPVSALSILRRSHTEAFVVLHDGAVVAEYYGAGNRPDQRRLMMSCTKSVVGLVCGSLEARQQLDRDRLVTDYVPELRTTGYAGATVQDVLDMRTGVRFVEDYADPSSEARRMEKAIGWRPSEDAAIGGPAFLCTIEAEHRHGGSFVYRSADTDVLGWVCERAAGRPMHELIQTLVWEPAGAADDALLITDDLGHAVHDGGLACTARDMARVGQAVLEGIHGPVARVASLRWLRDVVVPPKDVRDAFAASGYQDLFAGGWYRNQTWGWGLPSSALLFLGIHGQAVFVDPGTGVVAVKQSSWLTPRHPESLHATATALRAISEALGTR